MSTGIGWKENIDFRILQDLRSFFFFLLALLFPLAAQAGEEGKAGNLRGIDSFQVIVETLTQDAYQAGVTEEAVKSQVAAHFKASLPHISLLGEEGPSLYVRIVLHRRQKEDLYYGMISVNVDRPVLVLTPRENFPALSQVWEKTAVFSGRDPLLATFQILAKLLVILIEDFKKANP